MNPGEIARRLRRSISDAPRIAREASNAAAQRTATRAQREFAAAGLPIRAVVRSGGGKVRVVLQQTGPITRPVGRTSPRALVERIGREELRRARTDASSELRRRLTG
jgi:hypothetical protein